MPARSWPRRRASSGGSCGSTTTSCGRCGSRPPRRPYVVTTGTGSGKSLTYLLPIVDQIFRERHQGPSVRALVVYPMNALINSQLKALQEFKARNWPDCPLTFDRHTGQDRGDRERRNAMLSDPPQIVLTNYVMLEYMLIRPTERVMLERMTAELAFLAIDELHVYRGRQGADVAMLLRRLQQLVRRPGLLVSGTSATIASGGDPAARQRAVAEVGTRLFGVTVAADDVVDETLVRAATVPVPRGRDGIARGAGPAAAAADRVGRDGAPARGLDRARVRLGRGSMVGLERRLPTQVRRRCGRARRARSGVAAADAARRRCRPSSKPAARPRSDRPLRSWPFASTSSWLRAPASTPLWSHPTAATCPPSRASAWAVRGEDRTRLLFPLAFCRECGQELYLAARSADGPARAGCCRARPS